MAYIALQLTRPTCKRLSIVSLHLTWTGYFQPGRYTWGYNNNLFMGRCNLQRPMNRLYPGILWPRPIYTPEYIMA